MSISCTVDVSLHENIAWMIEAPFVKEKVLMVAEHPGRQPGAQTRKAFFLSFRLFSARHKLSFSWTTLGTGVAVSRGRI